MFQSWEHVSHTPCLFFHCYPAQLSDWHQRRGLLGRIEHLIEYTLVHLCHMPDEPFVKCCIA